MEENTETDTLVGPLQCRLATNLITYLRQEMGAQPAFAAIMVQLFEGTCYLTPLLGAYLADSHWGRYKTILVFSCIYMLVWTLTDDVRSIQP